MNYIAAFEFEPDFADELSLHEGEGVIALRHVDENWFLVTKILTLGT